MYYRFLTKKLPGNTVLPWVKACNYVSWHILLMLQSPKALGNCLVELFSPANSHLDSVFLLFLKVEHIFFVGICSIIIINDAVFQDEIQRILFIDHLGCGSFWIDSGSTCS